MIEEQLKEEEGSERKGISERDLIDEIKTFVLAGSETTSNFLVAMLFYAFEKPDVVKRLR